MSHCELAFWVVYLALSALAMLDFATSPQIERKDW